MTLLDKEPVKRVEKILQEFDGAQKIIVLDTSARTLLEASAGRRCLASERRTEVEAISFIGEVGELPVIVVRSKELGVVS